MTDYLKKLLAADKAWGIAILESKDKEEIEKAAKARIEAVELYLANGGTLPLSAELMMDDWRQDEIAQGKIE